MIVHRIIAVLLFSAAAMSAQQARVVTQQRIAETTGTSFVLLPGTAAAQQNVTLPAALPTVGQTLSVSTISGSDVTLGWSTPAGSGAALLTRRQTNITDAGGWTASGLTVAALASRTYAIRGFIRFSTQDQTRDGRIRFQALPLGATVSYVVVADRTAGPSYTATNVGEITLDTTVDNQFQTFYVFGTLTMSTTAGNVGLEFNKSGGSPDIIVGAGSYLLFVPLN